MAFADKMSRFSAPGPFGSTNLRAALASAREADVASPPPAMKLSVATGTPLVPDAVSAVQANFSQRAELSDAGVAEPAPVVADSEAMPARGTATPKPPKVPGAPEVRRALTYGAGPSGLLAGTIVQTDLGPRAVETLTPGDRVQTSEGPVAVLWCVACPFDEAESHAPVRFTRNVVGNTEPMTLSPMQRVQITGKTVSRLTGTDAALIGAHALVDGRAIVRVPASGRSCIILMLETHSLIEVSGTVVESFLPTRDRVQALSDDHQADFAERFPKWHDDPVSYGPSVRPILSALETVAQDQS